jgi:hypothetical protein
MLDYTSKTYSCLSFCFATDFVPHRTIAPLPFVPHPQQRRVTGIDEIDDPHVRLGRVLAVQATGVFPITASRAMS